MKTIIEKESNTHNISDESLSLIFDVSRRLVAGMEILNKYGLYDDKTQLEFDIVGSHVSSPRDGLRGIRFSIDWALFDEKDKRDLITLGFREYIYNVFDPRNDPSNIKIGTIFYPEAIDTDYKIRTVTEYIYERGYYTNAIGEQIEVLDHEIIPDVIIRDFLNNINK